MVFTTTNLFKGIQCPYGEQCTLTNCIFAHDLRPQNLELAESVSASISLKSNPQYRDTFGEPAAKRRKITYDDFAEKPPSKADQIRSGLAAARKPPASISEDNAFTASRSLNTPDPAPLKSLPSLTKRVSPPPTNGRAASQTSPAGANNTRPDNRSHNNSNVSTSRTTTLKPDAKSKEKLIPRLIPNDPAGHGRRSLYLKHLYGEMTRLNEEISKSQGLEYKQLLYLSEQELVKLALDQEEQVAKDQPMVYANIIKTKITLYKKMKLEDWVKLVKTSFDNVQPGATNKVDKSVDTGLTQSEELLILPHLVTDQTGLEKYGYVPTPPTDAQAAEAAAAVTASKNYEICDRCSARFQVFPERNEEGLLTSNGPCKHHPNKRVFPPKTRGDIVSGLPKEPYYPCCGSALGSPGCTENDFHVFKSSSPGRLAAVLPFITTPENNAPARDKHGRKVKAVTFDCEMGYTVYGLELIRLTAVAWPSGEELLDVLVQPVGIVIDLNSRFSGVWPDHFANAVPYDQWRSRQLSASESSSTHGVEASSSPSSLPMVESPAKARELLCSFLTPEIPLIGHAIDNDLNSVRLCHPSIIDTVVLFPHPRGLPMRFGLKMLTSRHLDRNIQMGGARGHDSLEDARATGDLIRFKIGEKWKLLRATGWQIINGQLIVPSPLRREICDDPAEGEADHVRAMVAKMFDGKAAGKKRRKKRPGSGADESTEDEEVPLGNGVGAYLQRANAMNHEAEKRNLS